MQVSDCCIAGLDPYQGNAAATLRAGAGGGFVARDPAPLMRGDDIDNLARDAGQNVLAEAASRVKAGGIHVEQLLLDCEGGALCDLVAASAGAWSLSPIVLGSHGRRGLRRMLPGSDAEQILRTSSVPVLLVRDNDPQTA